MFQHAVPARDFSSLNPSGGPLAAIQDLTRPLPRDAGPHFMECRGRGSPKLPHRPANPMKWSPNRARTRQYRKCANGTGGEEVCQQHCPCLVPGGHEKGQDHQATRILRRIRIMENDRSDQRPALNGPVLKWCGRSGGPVSIDTPRPGLSPVCNVVMVLSSHYLTWLRIVDGAYSTEILRFASDPVAASGRTPVA